MRLRKLLGIMIAVLAIAGCCVFAYYQINTDSADRIKAEKNTKVEVKHTPKVPSPVDSISYLDESDKSLDLKSVPESYLDPADQQGELDTLEYETKDYDDDEKEMTKYVVVYTPYDYNPEEEYDIIYMLHGHTGSANTWLGSPDDPNYTKNCLDHLIEDGYVKPMIAVSMTYYDNNEDEDTDNYDRDLLEPFGKELKNDIIPAVESKYSTFAKNIDAKDLTESRCHRIFCGFSMGGVTASYRICDSMDYFRYFIPLSGSFYWSNLLSQNDNKFNSGIYMADAIKKQGYGSDDFFIFSEAGTEDFAYDVVKYQVSDMQTMGSMFKFGMPGEDGVNCAYGIGADEDHDRHGRTTAIYNILPFISDMISE